MFIEAIFDSWTLFVICSLIMWLPGWPILALRKIQTVKKVKRGTSWKTSLTYLPNWSDFIRTTIISFLLMSWEDAYTRTHASDGLTASGAILITMIIGTSIQCLFIQHKRLFVLPSFYVMGLCFVAVSWDIWVFAVGFTLAIGFKLTNRNGLLPIFGLILSILGYVTGSPFPKLLIGVVVTLIPFVLFMITGKTGVQPSTLSSIKG